MRILALQTRYLPAFKSGGPVRSLQQLVARLGHEMAFSIITTDRDNGDRETFDGVTPGTWTEVGQARVNYLPPSPVALAQMARTIRQTPHDVLYLNSFLASRYSIAPVVMRALGLLPRSPLVIAPRGEFSPGALAIKSAKKAAFLRFVRMSGFWRDVTWQASTDNEARDIRAMLGVPDDRIVVASDMSPPLPATLPVLRPRAPGAPLRVLFLSRLVSKKNLSFVLEVLSGVNVPVHLTIAGPEEEQGYVRRCKSMAALLPDHIQVTWLGPVQRAELTDVLTGHDLFFLPTLGENFGHAIVEAFSAGLPVLLSDTTPWRGLQNRGIGYDLPLGDIDAFRAAIETEAALTPEAAQARRAAAFAFAREREANSQDVAAHRTLFETALLTRP